MLTQEVLDAIRKLEKKIRKVDCCNDCVEIDVTCDNGEVPVWNTALAKWECGSVASGGVTSISESGEAELTGDVTLSEGDNITLTQVGNDIEISTHAPVTLDSNQETTDSVTLTGQEITLNAATSSTYGVVKLEDLFANFERVANYSALPAANLHTDEYYHVESSQGTSWLPGSLGGTYYSKGFYYSDGASWNFVGEVPYQALQADVDAGIITDQFVSPATLASASQWATKNDAIQFKDEGSNLGAAGTVDTIDFVGSAVSAARVGDVLTVTVTGSSPAVISPSQITADQDNYNPTGFLTSTMVRLNFDTGGRAITGFAAGSDGQRITLSNISGNFGYYPGGHPDSSSGNRFLHGKDFIHYPYTNIDMIYDNTSGGWRIIGEENIDGKTGVFFSATDLASATGGDFRDFFPQGLSSGSVSTFTSTTSLPGGLVISSLSTTGGGGHMYFGKSTNTFSAYASAHIYTECLISIPTLSDGTETFSTELQLIQVPNAGAVLEGNNGIFIRYSHGINSGKWELVSQDNAGAESVADLAVTVTAATLYKLRIEIDKSKTEARAYINDAYVGRVVANLPDSVVCGARIVFLKSAGTTARTLNVHTFSAGAIY